MSMGITQALKMQRGSVREIAKLPQQQIMAMAQRQEIPAPMVPIILNEKARMAKEAQQMQAMQQMQAQGQPPTVTEQNMQAIDQAEMQDAMQQEAMRRRMMSGLGSMPMRDDMFRGASGGIVAFEDGGPVERYASRGFVIPDSYTEELDSYGYDVPSSFISGLQETADGDQASPVKVGEKGTDFESMVARTMKQLPESEEEKAYAEYMRNQRQRTAGQLEQDRALNLINLGAQIMGGTSPYAFTNIGQGLAAGLPAFQKTAQAQREAERENLKGLADMSRRNRDIALQTGAKLYEVEQESLGRELARDAAVRRAEIAAARERDTDMVKGSLKFARQFARKLYKGKSYDELSPAEKEDVDARGQEKYLELYGAAGARAQAALGQAGAAQGRVTEDARTREQNRAKILGELSDKARDNVSARLAKDWNSLENRKIRELQKNDRKNGTNTAEEYKDSLFAKEEDRLRAGFEGEAGSKAAPPPAEGTPKGAVPVTDSKGRTTYIDKSGKTYSTAGMPSFTEYDKLKSGTRFVDREGNIREKP